MSCGSVGSAVRGFRLVNRRSAYGLRPIARELRSKQPEVCRTQDKRPQGSREAPSYITRIRRWPGIQGSSLFQDAQSGEESTDLRCVSAKCLRDVGYAHGPQQADRRVSEGSHHFRTGTLADPARVLAHCDVTYVVRTILDRPMPPGPFEQLSRAGHRPRNTGDEVADLVRGLAVLDHLALDLSDLANTRPIQVLV